MTDNLYTLPQIAAICGIQYRTLHSWMKRGLLRVTHEANGSGHPALLTDEDRRLAEVLVQLRQWGLSMAVLEKVSRGWAPLADSMTFEIGAGMELVIYPKRT